MTTLSAASTNKFANEIGAQPPLGFYDPMGFLASEDETQYLWLRDAEIKHGRVAMLAMVGYLTTKAGYRIEGMEDIPAGFGVFNKGLYTTDLSRTNVIWTLTTMLILEVAIVRDGLGTGKHPGDYRNDTFKNWDKKADDYKLSQRAKELNNGRAAMMGILGLMVHEIIGNVDDLLPWLSN